MVTEPVDIEDVEKFVNKRMGNATLVGRAWDMSSRGDRIGFALWLTDMVNGVLAFRAEQRGDFLNE